MSALVVALVGCTPSGTGAPALPSAVTGSPRAAPSGDRLLLLGLRAGESTSGPLVVDVATGGVVRLGGQEDARSPSWSADGRQVAFVRRDPPGPSPSSPTRVVVADADGRDDAREVGDARGVEEVVASSDGATLAWLGRADPIERDCSRAEPGTDELSAASAPLDLVVAAVDGPEERRVLQTPATARSLAFSPDGSTLAWLDDGPGSDPCDGVGSLRLVLADVTDGTTRTVEGMTRSAGPPRWSPDGAAIALEGDSFEPDGNRDLVLVDVAAARARRVVEPATEETRPAWSPDGRQVAVLRRPEGSGRSSIVVLDREGSTVRTVTTTATAAEALAWSPDGRTLAWVGSVVTPMCGEGSGSRRVSGGPSVLTDTLAFSPAP